MCPQCKRLERALDVCCLTCDKPRGLRYAVDAARNAISVLLLTPGVQVRPPRCHTCMHLSVCGRFDGSVCGHYLSTETEVRGKASAVKVDARDSDTRKCENCAHYSIVVSPDTGERAEYCHDITCYGPGSASDHWTARPENTRPNRGE